MNGDNARPIAANLTDDGVARTVIAGMFKQSTSNILHAKRNQVYTAVIEIRRQAHPPGPRLGPVPDGDHPQRGELPDQLHGRPTLPRPGDNGNRQWKQR